LNRILDDITIVDLTHVQAGPMCTMFLSCMGANVIKIEPPWGEMLRGRESKDIRPTFAYFNRNKKGITLNLKSEKGKKIFTQLVEKADVVVENFSPGTMNRLGFGYENLQNIKSDIIYASISGFGHSGPYSNRGSFDLIAQAMCGIMSITGEPVGRPIRIHDYIGDSVTALFGTIAILGAIRFRDSTGKGQFIDIAQFDCMVSILSSIVTEMNKADEEDQQQGFRGIYDAVKAADGYIAIAAMRDNFLNPLAKIMGVEKIESREAIEEWSQQNTVKEIVAKLVKAEIPCAPVLNIEQVIEDPQFNARGMPVQVDQEGFGVLKLLDFAPKFSEMKPKVDEQAPTLGRHNEEILGWLGYNEIQIKELKQDKVI